MICEEEIPSPRTVRPDLPEELASVIMVCLQRNLELRFQSAAEVRRALSDFLFLGDEQGRPDDLTRLALHLLGKRKKLKESFLASVTSASHLQEYLFGELGDGMEGSGSTEEAVTSPRAEPSVRAVPREVAENEVPTAEAEPVVPEEASARRTSSVLPVAALFGLLVLLVAGLAGVVALVWPDGDQPPQEASSDKEQTSPRLVAISTADGGAPAEPDTENQDGGTAPADGDAGTETDAAGTDAGDQPDEAADEEPVGYLLFDTSPPTRVYIKGEYVGKTPIENMALEPGVYKLEIFNEAEGISKTYRVRIRKGRVTSHRFIF
jgi:hypothetical protein